MSGILYLIPNTLGEHQREELLPLCMPEQTMKQASQIQHWIVENAKTARALLKAVHVHHPLVCTLQEMQMSEWRGLSKEKNQTNNLRHFLQPALDGHDMGLMSEAGVPAVADPGSEIVQLAHQLGIQVKPLVGPSSLLLAVMASGMNGQNFCFKGYLPVSSDERAMTLKQLEQESRQKRQTQLWIETPYRSQGMFQTMMDHLGPQTQVAIAADLSLPTEWIYSASVSAWRERLKKEKQLTELLHQKPCVFLLLAH